VPARSARLRRPAKHLTAPTDAPHTQPPPTLKDAPPARVAAPRPGDRHRLRHRPGARRRRPRPTARAPTRDQPHRRPSLPQQRSVLQRRPQPQLQQGMPSHTRALLLGATDRVSSVAPTPDRGRICCRVTARNVGPQIRRHRRPRPQRHAKRQLRRTISSPRARMEPAAAWHSMPKLACPANDAACTQPASSSSVSSSLSRWASASPARACGSDSPRKTRPARAAPPPRLPTPTCLRRGGPGRAPAAPARPAPLRGRERQREGQSCHHPGGSALSPSPRVSSARSSRSMSGPVTAAAASKRKGPA
jgi:hypothetical protein